MIIQKATAWLMTSFFEKHSNLKCDQKHLKTTIKWYHRQSFFSSSWTESNNLSFDINRIK